MFNIVNNEKITYYKWKKEDTKGGIKLLFKREKRKMNCQGMLEKSVKPEQEIMPKPWNEGEGEARHLMEKESIVMETHAVNC